MKGMRCWACDMYFGQVVRRVDTDPARDAWVVRFCERGRITWIVTDRGVDTLVCDGGTAEVVESRTLMEY